MSIIFQQVNHIYFPKTKLEYWAIKNINLEIQMNKITFVVGHTGSGKSTLIQHLNALLLPTSGEIQILDRVIVSKKKKNKKLKSLRKQVGVVFQFPEYQLFEETVAKDIAFGPKNFGVAEEEITKIVKESLMLVGLDESFLERSPFELSGGQKRRVAIAGILALNPEVIILDEPTAGLDPKGAYEIMQLLLKLKKEGKTIIIVSHDMDNVLKYGDYVVVLNHGEFIFKGEPNELFLNEKIMQQTNIIKPELLDFAISLQDKGINLEISKIKDIDDLVEQLAKLPRGDRYE